MDFDKVINNVQELQQRVEFYEQKNRKIDDAIITIDKDLKKIEKKLEKEEDAINKKVLELKILIMRDVSSRFQL